jgi:hypothetical protein
MPNTIDRLAPRLKAALDDPEGPHLFTPVEADMLCHFIRIRAKRRVTTPTAYEGAIATLKCAAMGYKIHVEEMTERAQHILDGLGYTSADYSAIVKATI